MSDLLLHRGFSGISKVACCLWNGDLVFDSIVIMTSIGFSKSSSEARYLVVIIICLTDSATNTLSGGVLSQGRSTVKVTKAAVTLKTFMSVRRGLEVVDEGSFVWESVLPILS